MRMSNVLACAAVVLTAGAAAASVQPLRAHAGGAFTMSTAAALPGADGGTEPRYTVTPDGKHYAISNKGGTAFVWESDDGLTGWHLTNSTGIANQTVPSIDVDIVSMPAGAKHAGRLIAVELDFGGINFRISYSDDGGATWTSSSELGAPDVPANELGDQDRPWLATGPDDRVYLLFHNLASGLATHHMFVSTSTDDGASFGAPVDSAPPGTQAYTDLQCADSGGPSDIFVNQQNGRVYAVFGTRSSVAGGGCGASITGSPEINVVAATRVWVATATESSATSETGWQQSLAVDDNASGKIVGMQLAPGAIDSAGNVYVLYPESTHTYPNYDGAAIKYVHATESGIVANPYGALGPAHQVWSSPVTVAPSGGAGHLLPHIIAGGPGEIDMAYFSGVEIPGSSPATTAKWYIDTAQTTDALSAHPSISYWRIRYPGTPVQPQPAYSQWTASQMMGACGNSIQNGTSCNRSTDVWGIALDSAGNLQVTWPSASAGKFGCSSSVHTPPPCTTWTSAQIAGPTIAPVPGTNVPESPWAATLLGAGAGAAVLMAAARRRREGRLGR